MIFQQKLFLENFLLLREYIFFLRFFSWHSIFYFFRYQFKDGKRVALREIGPRFTLKLRWLQRGTFDTKTGEYIWLLKVCLLCLPCLEFKIQILLFVLCTYFTFTQRHEMETSRRRFFLWSLTTLFTHWMEKIKVRVEVKDLPLSQ